MEPKASVIVPVYRTEQYLAECLNSIIGQTLQELEIIVINDASPDRSVDIVRDFQEKDSRIVLIDKKENEGVGKARNDGIQAAKGEFLCFMDSDDLYSDLDVLRKLYNAAKENHVLVSCGREEKLLTDGTIEISHDSIEENGLSFSQIGLMKYSDFQYDYGYQSYLFDRNMIIENQIEFPRYSRFQDPPFFVKAMVMADTYYAIDQPIYRYRQLGSESKYTMKKTLDMLSGVMDNLRFSRENGLAKLHCLSAHRLNTEGSFMAIHNVCKEGNQALLAKLIEASQSVDVQWLRENGYDIPEPFVLDVFLYLADTAGKYERLRNGKLAKWIRKVKRNG